MTDSRLFRPNRREVWGTELLSSRAPATSTPTSATPCRLLRAGYSVSATIVEERSGTSYERFLRREFFDPLGLHDTGYRMAGWSKERPAIGYRAAWGGPCQHCSPIRTSTQTSVPSLLLERK